jgi:ABC-type polysaccharide/polyol phosphate export permease
MSLRVFDPAAVPEEPDAELLHRHKWNAGASVKELWARREIIFTLAERDVRANYKEATLGIAWAVLTPLVTLIVLILVFKRVKTFHTGDAPYALFAYLGILPWQYFSSSFGSGGNALLSNKGLLSKVHFPRECFPLAQILEAALNTALALPVLFLLFVMYHYPPHVQGLWFPVFALIEVMFTAGIVLAASALLVHVRDLVQVIPVVTSLGMFATPVIWPFSRLSVHVQAIYSFFNPLGPVIDNLRRTILYGQSPTWGLLAIAFVGASLYLIAGYSIFKRLEADLADIA